ncbi:MAG: hypothetical protein AAFY29_20070 [Pseudomonadota bacterium]
MRTILCTFCALSLIYSSIAYSQQGLQGDPEAVALIDKLLERLGGKEVWARTRTLYLEYHGWRKNPAQPVIERAWRDLQQPNQRMEFEGTTSDVVLVFTPESSWVSRDGVVEQRAEKALDSDLEFWPYDFYTIIHNLAVADPRIRLSFEAPMRVSISSIEGDDWGWWEIDSTGAPIRWGASFEGDPLEYIYGPVKSYGNINFPAWGTAIDGFWRFEYVDVDVSLQPVPSSYLEAPTQ